MSGAAENPIEVTAGLVFRDGKLLIAQRPQGGHLGGLWEFPGGKREPGETFEQCLHRELREELGIEIKIGKLVDDIVHQYPERTVRLKFFRCQWLRNEPQPLSCDNLAWITKEELSEYPFPDADARILDKLRLGPEMWDSGN